MNHHFVVSFGNLSELTFFICEKEKEKKKSYLYKEEILKGNNRNMIIKNIIIQNKKLKINECSCAQIKHLQHQLRKDVIHLYHDQGIQWEFGDVKHSVQKYTYQLSANEIVEIIQYLEFLSKNMDQRFQKLHETYLTHQEQDILIDFMNCDMNISKVAAKHHLHRYQIYHMFDEIREKTKLDPRCFYDLETLHMELERRKNDE